MFKPIAFLMEKTMKNPHLNRDQLIMLREDNVCDIRGMKKDFNIQPKPSEDTIMKMSVNSILLPGKRLYRPPRNLIWLALEF